MRRKFSIVILVIIFLSMAIFNGCTKSTTGGEKKELVFAISSEIPNLDPQIATDGYAITIGNAVFEGLVRVHDGKVYPGMAEKWEVSPDKRVYTFHLRDAKWSDGSKVTAYDFEYAIKRLLDPKTASEYAYQGYYILNGEDYNNGKITDPNQIGVKALDEKTLQITLASPTKYFESLLSFISFMPTKKEYVDKYGSKYAADADKILYNGPFILKEWKHEQELVLEKNPYYWNKDAIKLDRVKIYIITDPNTAYQMYENGQIDFVDVPPIYVEKLVNEGKALTYYDGYEFFIRFNLKAKGKPWLANENFRKAIGFAIDREDYINMAFKKISEPATRYIPPVIAGIEKKFVEEYPLEYYPRKADVNKAKEYLNKAMKELKISDPSKMGFELIVDDNSGTKVGVEAIQDMLRRNLGIDVTVKTVTFKERLQKMRSGDYEVMITRWGPDYDDPMTYLDYWFTSDSMIASGWSVKEFDDLIKFAKSTPDFKKRADAMFEAEKMLLERAPLIPLYYRQKVWTCKDYVKGLVRNFIGPDPDFVYAYIEGKK